MSFLKYLDPYYDFEKTQNFLLSTVKNAKNHEKFCTKKYLKIRGDSQFHQKNCGVKIFRKKIE